MERLGVGGNSSPTDTLHDFSNREDGMDVETNYQQADLRQQRGRTRSRRADGKDAMEPVLGRPVLSMGYRADCDKCRARVPGHYTHVLRG